MTNPGNLLDRWEELDPEFDQWTTQVEGLGLCIQHPIYYSIMHHPAMNAFANEALRHKRAAIEQAREEGRWSNYLMLHERPWRLEAFMNICDQIPAQDYWELLGWLWTDSENIWQNEEEWRILLTSDAPYATRIMDRSDYQKLRDMPSTFQVFRGFYLPGRHMGLSWTLSKDQAEWFALRFQKATPMVWGATVSSDDVIAYTTSRGEDEIIVLPEKLRSMRSLPFSPQSANFHE